MHIILGGTGHVGSAVAETLLAQNQDVTIVTHDPAHAPRWEAKGAHVAIADAHDSAALRAAFERGRRLFLLNPPADPKTDTDREEHATLRAILDAVQDSGLEKIVAESAYAARPAQRSGDLGTLYDMERALAAQPIPSSVIRAAYYMSNWDAALPSARDDGRIQSFYPVDFALPMVAPHDLGRFGAKLLLEPVTRTGTHYVEGPRAYSADDVARAFGSALHRSVQVDVVPRDGWVAGYRALGFSEPAAESYARMTAITLDRDYPLPDASHHGETTLDDYIAALVARGDAPY